MKRDQLLLKYRLESFMLEEKARIKEIREEQKEARKEAESVEKRKKEAQKIEKSLAEKKRKIEDQIRVATEKQMTRELETLREKVHFYEEEIAKNAALLRKLSVAEITKKGVVYVISNEGAFGPGVYKIGMTRRYDPQERIDELGDASVPFEFDVHTMAEVDNAPEVEHQLHEKFRSSAVNLVNRKKEFFRVPLGEIQAAFASLKTPCVWKENAPCLDFRESTRRRTKATEVISEEV